MDRNDKIEMMNEILALDEELDRWIRSEEALLAEESSALRERLAALQDKIARLNEGEDPAIPEPEAGSGYGCAESLRREAAAENTRLRESFQAKKSDIVAQLLAKLSEN